jgi:hypothetical protein
MNTKPLGRWDLKPRRSPILDPRPHPISGVELHNNTKWSQPEVKKMKLLGTTINKWRGRRISLYQNPEHEDRVVSIGQTLDGSMEIICDEPKSDWQTALDYAAQGKVYTSECADASDLDFPGGPLDKSLLTKAAELVRSLLYATNMASDQAIESAAERFGLDPMDIYQFINTPRMSESEEMTNTREIVEKKLTTSARKNLSKKSFVFKKDRRYPINDISHARNALARVSQHGTPAEKAKVRSAVHSKFPNIKMKESLDADMTELAKFRKSVRNFDTDEYQICSGCGQIMQPSQQTQCSSCANTPKGHEICGGCGGDGFVEVQDGVMACYRCGGSGYTKREVNDVHRGELEAKPNMWK